MHLVVVWHSWLCPDRVGCAMAYSRGSLGEPHGEHVFFKASFQTCREALCQLSIAIRGEVYTIPAEYIVKLAVGIVVNEENIFSHECAE